MIITIYDVAKHAGVSIATVSRVINNTGNVRAKTEEKVRRAMEELNFTPNSLAQSFAKMKSNTIGLITASGPTFSDSEDSVGTVYFTELFRGINRVLQKKGYSLLIINAHEHLEQIINGFLDQKRIDGLIIGSKPNNTDTFRKVIENKKPIVYIGQIDEFNKGLHVYAQHSQYLKKVFDYLRSKHHTHIAYYGTKSEQELKLIIQDDHVKIHYIDPYQNPEALHQRFRQCFSDKQRPTALFKQSTEGIQPVISILNELGLSVPDDVSIICTEHIKGQGENYFPSITNVYVPVYEMGKTAAKVLLDYIEGTLEDYDQQFNLESKLIERGSVIALK